MVNDEHRKPDGIMKKIVTNDGGVEAVHLCIFVLRDIKCGEEIRYDASGKITQRQVRDYSVFSNESWR